MLRSKTVCSALTALVGSLAAYFLEEIQLGEMLQIVITSILAVFLRHGIKKAEDAAS